jgi:hypothetical protein
LEKIESGPGEAAESYAPDSKSLHHCGKARLPAANTLAGRKGLRVELSPP